MTLQIFLISSIFFKILEIIASISRFFFFFCFIQYSQISQHKIRAFGIDISLWRFQRSFVGFRKFSKFLMFLLISSILNALSVAFINSFILTILLELSPLTFLHQKCIFKISTVSKHIRHSTDNIDSTNILEFSQWVLLQDSIFTPKFIGSNVPQDAQSKS